MITDYQKLKIPDVNNRPVFFVEVNWKSDDPDTNECKLLKVTFPDKTEVFIKKEALMGLLWLFGTSEEHQRMIPMKLQRVKHYETVLGITATKDIRKGEKINFAIKIPLPVIEEETISGERKVGKTESGILLPK